MLKRTTKGMPIPKLTVHDIEQTMSVDDAIKIIKQFEALSAKSK